MARSINASMKPELIAKFMKAVESQDEKPSHVIQDCVKAYIDLVRRANGRRISALEFKGFEENTQLTYFPTLPRANYLVAEPRAEYSKTGKTKK
jgi:hypothetical protein